MTPAEVARVVALVAYLHEGGCDLVGGFIKAEETIDRWREAAGATADHADLMLRELVRLCCLNRLDGPRFLALTSAFEPAMKLLPYLADQRRIEWAVEAARRAGFDVTG